MGEKREFFSTSLDWYVVTGFCLFAFFFGLGTISLILTKPNYIFATTLFAISFIEFYLAYRSYSIHVRKAWFYKNSFEIVRRRKRHEFQYSQMQRVTRVKGIWLGDSVSITIAEEKQPIIIPRNPKSSMLGTDLCTFLRQKTSKHLV